jgi:hypothetical protein
MCGYINLVFLLTVEAPVKEVLEEHVCEWREWKVGEVL